MPHDPIAHDTDLILDRKIPWRDAICHQIRTRPPADALILALLSGLEGHLPRSFAAEPSPPWPDAQGILPIATPPTTDHHRLTTAAQQRRWELDTMTTARRSAFFEELLPGWSALLEAAWQKLQGGPVRREWMPPFRSPHHPADSLDMRCHWFQDLCGPCVLLPDTATLIARAAAVAPSEELDSLGRLLAVAVDQGGEAGESVLQQLLATLQKPEKTLQFDQHLLTALAACNRPEAWDAIEQRFETALRQEGLREALLDAAGQAHPRLFHRLLQRILDQDLLRFASVARAVAAWLAFPEPIPAKAPLRDALHRAVRHLGDPAARAQALPGQKGQEAAEIYVALWAMASEDVHAALHAMEPLIDHPDPAVRFALVWLLRAMALPCAQHVLIALIADPDPRVAMLAAESSIHFVPPAGIHETPWSPPPGRFEKMQALAERLPEKRETVPSPLWPWSRVTLDRGWVLDHLAEDAAGAQWQVIFALYPQLSAEGRSLALHRLSHQQPFPEGCREWLLACVGETSEYARGSALSMLREVKLRPEEAPPLEALLSRKADDLRGGVIRLLASQSDADALASAARLATARHAGQRLAGIELLHELHTAERDTDACTALARTLAEKPGKPPGPEATLLDAMLGEAPPAASIDNALGLMDPARLTRPPLPADRQAPLITAATHHLILALDAFIHAHGDATYPAYPGDDPGQTVRLGERVKDQGLRIHPDDPDAPTVHGAMPLAELWHQFDRERNDDTRDADGLEYWRAWVLLGSPRPWLEPERLHEQVLGQPLRPKLRHGQVAVDVLGWLVHQPPYDPATLDRLLDVTESLLAAAPAEAFWAWLRNSPLNHEWIQRVAHFHRHRWREDQRHRMLQLLFWYDRPWRPDGIPPYPKGAYLARRVMLPADLLGEALRLEVLNEDDLFDGLLGPQSADAYAMLAALTTRGSQNHPARDPRVQALVRQAVDRLLTIELRREEAPLPTTAIGQHLKSITGAHWLIRLLESLRHEGLARGLPPGLEVARHAKPPTRQEAFSRMIRLCVPGADDAPATFAQQVRQAGLKEKQLLELALFAPAWAGWVEHALQWPGLEEGAWWLYAHARDPRDFPEEPEAYAQALAPWASAIADRTALKAEDLLCGAVDVAWFHRMHRVLGPERWQALERAARNIFSRGGHQSALRFASAMQGTLDPADLRRRITEKRDRDALRAFGLLPLTADDERAPDTVVLERYDFIQGFLRGGKPSASQRGSLEQQAATIALQNLARTAGHADPLELEWAMACHAIADLIAGPVQVTAGNVGVTLALTLDGQPQLTATRQAQPLASLPAPTRKVPQVAALIARQASLDHLAARTRAMLENRMARAETFREGELLRLMTHPILRPILERLVLIGERVAGYPTDGGAALIDHTGATEAIGPRTALRIAHPLDLLRRGDWPAWQQACLAGQHRQPFKQVFRELYVLTEAEQIRPGVTCRYAGQQIKPRQALALLGKRGWMARYEEGICKTFREHGFTAWVDLAEGFGSLPIHAEVWTFEGLHVTRIGSWEPLGLEQLPGIVLSEIMRDLDLVVSVAHRSDVDPEASLATVTMRGSLVRETLAVLGLPPARIENSRARIQGRLAEYALHLGSGEIHLLPGGALFVMPVHPQDRGRLFLPFADDDPKTAEILSKALLLTDDEKIRDPGILRQIRALQAGGTATGPV